ncbi:MAG: RimK/LysX family protein [Bacteroidia bacterium]|nr:RimK/LysX family protein [Bacteroidia bacterium]
MKKKRLIGRSDKADFPELDLFDIDIKIDTGAYTSAIHCHKIKEKEIDGERMISFVLLDPSHPQYNKKEYRAKIHKEKLVKSSNGKSQKRYIIKTKIVLFGKKYSIELSLSERGEMRYPVLIGRKLLRRKFIVDSDLSNLSYQLKIQNSQQLKKRK